MISHGVQSPSHQLVRARRRQLNPLSSTTRRWKSPLHCSITTEPCSAPSPPIHTDAIHHHENGATGDISKSPQAPTRGAELLPRHAFLTRCRP